MNEFDTTAPMLAVARLSQQTNVDVLSRIAHSGDAAAQSGDFEACALTAKVGAKHVLTLTFDRIHP